MKLVVVLCCAAAGAMAQKDLGRILPENQPLHIVAFGDYGDGRASQKAVAAAISKLNTEHPFTFGITMGDNFYFCGVRSVEDPKWQTHWEDIYTPLGFPFYASLGNHDYGNPPIICPLHRGSPQAEIDRTSMSKSWRMPAHYYTYTAGAARFIAIDTEGWSAEQLEWIRKTLEASRNEPGIKWRVVYGHHPIYTSGVHLNERRIGALRRELLPVMLDAKVDLYIAGHDHDMEHLRSQGMEFLICGGGGAKIRALGALQPQSVFSKGRTHGFLDIDLDDRRVKARFLDPELNSLEQPELEMVR